MSKPTGTGRGSSGKIAFVLAAGLCASLGIATWFHLKSPAGSASEPKPEHDQSPAFTGRWEEWETAPGTGATFYGDEESVARDADFARMNPFEYSSDTADLWTGSLSDNTAAELSTQCSAEALAAFFPREQSSFGTDPFLGFLARLSLEGKPVASVISYGDNGYKFPVRSIRVKPDFFRALLSLPDSSLQTLKAGFDTAFAGRISLRTEIENLLLARKVFEANPSLHKVLDFIFDNHIELETESWGGFAAMALDDSIAGYIENNQEYLGFWIDRGNDRTDSLANAFLHRFARLGYGEEIRMDRLQARAAAISDEKRPEPGHPPLAQVFFDTSTFIDPEVPPEASRLDVRKKVIRKYILSSFLTLAEPSSITIRKKATSIAERVRLEFRESNWSVYPDPDGFSEFLFNSGSKYFSPEMDYYRFSYDSSRQAYGWESVSLDPRMRITGYSLEDGDHHVGLQLRFQTEASGKTPILYTGIPVGNGSHPAPKGGTPANLKSREVKAIRDSVYCRLATETFAVPPGLQPLRGLFTRTFYRKLRPSECWLGDLPGQNPDGLVFANTGRTAASEEGEESPGRDTTANMILQEKAELYMITPAQDTVLLHTDFARSGFGDGETDYSQAARCRTPLFTDANGDGREDFMVETSTGQALFFQQRDGSFKP